MPSSKYLANMMIMHIDFQDAQFIVEYGPGTGSFTRQLINKRKPSTVILLIESNPTFYNHLLEKYKDEQNVYIVNGSAENLDIYLANHGIPYVDYVVSGLPFASLPRRVSRIILAKTKIVLNKEGRFITFQYTQINKPFFSEYFVNMNVTRELRNLPPAYVYSCGN
jgi:phospholipid N-methyltransferase